MNLSVVIPVYNESENIRTTMQELFSVANKIPDIAGIQIVVVDDHSSDGTYDVAKELNDPRIICLRLSRRSGSHIALRAGIRESTGDAALCISADGQDNFSCLGGMLEKWRAGSSIVWGLRQNRQGEPWYIRKPAQIFYRVLLRLLNSDEQKIDLSRADFFLMDRVIMDAVNACPERNTSLFGLLAWLGFKQDFTEYERRPRLSGKSKWNFKSRLNLAKDWIIAFSGLPLRLASSAGMAMAILGALAAAYIIIDKFFFSNIIPGWTSIVVLILIMGGIQLIILGIIGEYLWRTLDETRARPLFFIEKSNRRGENK